MSGVAWGVISDIASAVSSISVVGGLWIAHQQLNAWRESRKSEVAERLFVASQKVSDAYRVIRTPVDFIPSDVPECDRQDFRLNKRLEIIREFQSVFDELRLVQISAMALIPDEDMESAVDSLIEIKGKVIAAIQMLRVDLSSNPQLVIKLKGEIYGLQNDQDELWLVEKAALEKIKTTVLNVLRTKKGRR